MISADHMDFRWLIFLGPSLFLELRVVLVSEAYVVLVFSALLGSLHFFVRDSHG